MDLLKHRELRCSIWYQSLMEAEHFKCVFYELLTEEITDGN